VIEYASEIRVSIELVLTLGSLWWSIRAFALTASRRDQLKREEDDGHEQLASLQAATQKLQEAAKKVREKVIPGQLGIIHQFEAQMANVEKELEKTELPEKIRLYQEVKQFYTQDPGARYFRASDWTPQDESL